MGKLSDDYPVLVNEWHNEKNGKLRPCDVMSKSHIKVWWICSMKHEWRTAISHRSRGDGCPYCAGKKPIRGETDLQTLYPELAKEWDYEKNGALTPCDVTAGSHKIVFWILPYDDPKSGKHFIFRWKASIQDRVRGRGCPYLAGRAVWKGFNDLASRNPRLAQEWHPFLNGKLKPDEVTDNSNRIVWWRKTVSDPDTGEVMDLEWQASVANRNRRADNPFEAGKMVKKEYNSLSKLRPDIAKEWHPIKNGKLTPDDVTPGSNKTVWWIITYTDLNTGECFDMEWKATVWNRTAGKGCPYVGGHAVLKGFNDLKTLNPELAAEWDTLKNGRLSPDMVTAKSEKKIWWRCPQCGKLWRASIDHRSNGQQHNCDKIKG